MPRFLRQRDAKSAQTVSHLRPDLSRLHFLSTCFSFLTLICPQCRVRNRAASIWSQDYKFQYLSTSFWDLASEIQSSSRINTLFCPDEVLSFLHHFVLLIFPLNQWKLWNSNQLSPLPYLYNKYPDHKINILPPYHILYPTVSVLLNQARWWKITPIYYRINTPL